TDALTVQDGIVCVPSEDRGIDDDELYIVRDLLTGSRYTWRGARNYVRLDPVECVGHVFKVSRLVWGSTREPCVAGQALRTHWAPRGTAKASTLPCFLERARESSCACSIPRGP